MAEVTIKVNGRPIKGDTSQTILEVMPERRNLYPFFL